MGREFLDEFGDFVGYIACTIVIAMEIRFVSTLTPEDEERLASVLLRAAASILDETGLAYTLRVETSSERVFQHHSPAIAGGTSRARTLPEVIVPYRPATAES